MTIWDTVRQEFPVCNKYTYLNAAGGSPVSLRASDEAQRFYKEMSMYGDLYYDQWIEQTEEIRQRLASYIGAEKNEIAFTTNTSQGMNLIAHWLKDQGKVISMMDEFPSSTLPWINQGKEIIWVAPHKTDYTLEIGRAHV